MSVNIKHRDDGGVVVTVEGLVDSDEIVQANKYVNRTVHANNLVPYEIWDWSKSDLSKFSIEGSWIEKPPVKAGETNPDAFLLIVTGDDLNYGLARVWKGWAGDEYDTSKIYRTLDEADSWLAENLK